MKNPRVWYILSVDSSQCRRSMIISASRRTDIPAFYSPWLINRLKAGWCLVPNPLNPKQVFRVSLSPHDVDAIVFWSKNPLPLLSRLDEVDDMGFRYYFQFTLNDYPAALEPGLPPIEKRVDIFLQLSQRIGPQRVVWRYDPIIISNLTPVGYHCERFSWLAERLNGATHRVMVSFVCLYRKTMRRLSRLEQQDSFKFDRDTTSQANLELLKELAAIAAQNGIQMLTCAATPEINTAGIPPGKCIDDSLIRQLWGRDVRYRKDPAQRQHCMCTLSKDIGAMDTCLHGCVYCYSTRNLTLAKRRSQRHSPDAPALWLPHGGTEMQLELVQQRALPV